MRRALLITAALLMAAACGRKGTLRPVPGEATAPATYGASAPATTERALTPPPETVPERVDDVIRRPELERRDDPFNLPPPSGAAR